MVGGGVVLHGDKLSYAGSMTSPVTESRVPPRGSLGPSPSRPLGGTPPGPDREKHGTQIPVNHHPEGPPLETERERE